MKKYKYLITIAFIVSSSSLICQTSFDWIFQIANTSGGTISSSISVDNNNSVYSTGSFSGTFTYGNQIISSSSNGNSAFLAKHDKIKKLLWCKIIGDAIGNTQGTSVCSDKLGNIYISGIFSQKTKIDSQILITTGNKASFLAKYNSNGELLWVKMFESTDEMNIMSICATSIGDIYFGGYSKGTVELGDLQYNSNDSKAFVVKIDNNGNILWALTSENNTVSSSEIRKLVVDEFGNACSIGVFSGTFNFGGKTFTSNSINSFITKIKSTGVFDWTVQIGGSQNDVLTDIDTKNGYIGVIGNILSSDIEIKGNIDIILNSTGKAKILALAFKSDGEYLWNSIYGDGINKSFGYAVNIDNQSNYYLGGSCSGTVDFNTKDPSTPIIPAGKGGADMFLVKLNYLGNTLFANRFGGATTEQINDMCISDDDNILFTAAEFKRRVSGSSSYTTTNFAMQGDEFNLTTLGASSNTGLCMYTIPQITTKHVSATQDQKVSDCLSQTGGGKASFLLIGGSLPNGLSLTSKGFFAGTPTEIGTFNFKVSLILSDNGFDKTYQDITMIVLGSTLINEIKDTDTNNKINIFPNPNNGTFSLNLPSEFLNNSYSFEIYDMLGNLIFKRDTYHSQNQITLKNCNKGYYMIRIYNSNRVLTCPFILQ